MRRRSGQSGSRTKKKLCIIFRHSSSNVLPADLTGLVREVYMPFYVRRVPSTTITTTSSLLTRQIPGQVHIIIV